MPEKVFKPKYSKGVFIGLFVMVYYVAYSFFGIIQGTMDETAVIIIIIFFPAICFFVFSFEKRVVFKESQIIVEKYFFPPKTLNFTTVYDIGKTVIQTDAGNFMIQGMKNSEELKAIFQEIMDNSKNSNESFENKLAVKQKLAERAVKPSVLLTFIIVMILTFSGVIKIEGAVASLPILILLILIYIITYLTIRYLDKRKQSLK